MMPKMNGVAFKEKINKLKKHEKTPFLMITALDYNVNKDLKLSLGFNDYIVKPFDKNEIITRVKKLLKNDLYRGKLFSIDDHKTTYSNTDSKIIEQINTIINENLTNPDLSVPFLSVALDIHEKKLNRMLQTNIGLTAIKVITEVRLLKAYDYIIKSEFKTISEVMYAVGFNSRPNFYNKFHKRFGIKPGDLKKKYS